MHKSFAFVSNEAYDSGLEYYAMIMLMQTGNYCKFFGKPPINNSSQNVTGFIVAIMNHYFP